MAESEKKGPTCSFDLHVKRAPVLSQIVTLGGSWPVKIQIHPPTSYRSFVARILSICSILNKLS